MKVKIGDRIYDSNYVPIMIIIDNQDKKNIANMPPEANKYCFYPDDEEYDDDLIKKFMKI